MLFRSLFIAIVLLFAAPALADGPAVALTREQLSDPANKELREWLRANGVHLADTKRWPQLREALARVAALTAKLHDPRIDGPGPVEVMLVDDMRVNAFFLRPKASGRKTVAVTLGLLGFARTDDELAYVIGHELERGVSQVGAQAGKLEKAAEAAAGAADEMKKVGAHFYYSAFVAKTEENELDVKSIIRRVGDNGFNPYDGDRFVARLEQRGDGFSGSRTSLGTRKSVLASALTSMARVWGKAATASPSQKTIVEPVADFLASPELKAARKAELEALLKQPVAIFGRQLKKIAHDKVDDDLLKSLGRPFREGEANSMEDYKYPAEEKKELGRRLSRIYALGEGSYGPEELLERKMRLHRHFNDEFLRASQAAGEIKVRSPGQALALALLEEREVIPPFVRSGWQSVQAVSDMQEVRRSRENVDKIHADQAGGKISPELAASREAEAMAELKRHEDALRVSLSAYLPEKRERAAELVRKMAEQLDSDQGRVPEELHTLDKELVSYIRGIDQPLDFFERRQEREIAGSAKLMKFDLENFNVLEDYLGLHRRLSPQLKRPMAFPMGDALVEAVGQALAKADSAERRRELLGRVQHVQKGLFWRQGAWEQALDPQQDGPFALDHFRRIYELFLARAESRDELALLYPRLLNPGHSEGAWFSLDPQRGVQLGEVFKDALMDEKFFRVYLGKLNRAGFGRLQGLPGEQLMQELEAGANHLADLQSSISRAVEQKRLAPEGAAELQSSLLKETREGFFAAAKAAFKEKYFAHLPAALQERYADSLFSVRFYDLRSQLADGKELPFRAVLNDLAAFAKNPEIARKLGREIRFADAYRFAKPGFPDVRQLMHYLGGLGGILSSQPSTQAAQALYAKEIPFFLQYAAVLNPQSIPYVGQVGTAYSSPLADQETQSKIWNSIRETQENYMLRRFAASSRKEAPYTRAQVADAFYDWGRSFGAESLSYEWVGGNRSQTIMALLDDPRVDLLEFGKGYVEGTKRAYAELARTAETARERARYESGLKDFGEVVRKKLEDIEQHFFWKPGEAKAFAATKSPEWIAEYLNFTTPFHRTSFREAGGTRDVLFGLAFEHAKDPKVARWLMDPKLAGTLYFKDDRERLVTWQLDQKINLAERAAKLKAGKAPVPHDDKVRGVVREARAWIDSVYPNLDAEKTFAVEAVEKRLLTSQAESRYLRDIRLNADNWVQSSDLAKLDIPYAIRRTLKSHEDRMELVDYLVGLTQGDPRFVTELKEQYRRNPGFVDDDLQSLRRQFQSSDVFARSFMLQSMFDEEVGVLSDARILQRVYDTILAGYKDDPMLKEVFHAYLESVPAVERRSILSYIYASLAKNERGGGASLRMILEAMGPFGIKAGQALRSSGKLSPNLARELEDFFHNAMPPHRPMIFSDLERFFGPKLQPLAGTRELVGSGSINYTVRAEMKQEGAKPRQVLVRIRRDAAIGQVQNENANWEAAIAKLRNSASPESRNVANLLEEARLTAMETLKPGGIEFDLSYERDKFGLAERTYGSGADPKTGYRIEVSRPIQEYQKLIPEELQKAVSIYEYVPNVAFESLSAEEKARVAGQIVGAELKALFEHGAFDPDGHIGNWLIDKENGRLVRIDYAQIRTIEGGALHEGPLAEAGASRLGVIKGVLGRLVLPRMGGSDFRYVAGSLEQLFDFPAHPPVDRGFVAAELNRIASDTKFPPHTEPHQRMLELRLRLEESLKRKYGPDFFLSLKPDFRATLASLGRMVYYREFMPGGSWEKLMAKYVEPPKLRMAVQLAGAKGKDAAQRVIAAVERCASEFARLARSPNMPGGR